MRQYDTVPLMKERKTGTAVAVRRLTLAAMLAALGTVIVWLGALLDVMDLSSVALAALCVLLARRELPLGYAIGVFGVTALLAFLLTSNWSPAVMYLLLGGWYPLVREPLAKCRPLIAWPCKILLFCAATTGYLVLSVVLLGLPAEVWWLNALIYVVGTAGFVLYDILLGRIALLYAWRLRPRIEHYLP